MQFVLSQSRRTGDIQKAAPHGEAMWIVFENAAKNPFEVIRLLRAGGKKHSAPINIEAVLFRNDLFGDRVAVDGPTCCLIQAL